MYRQQRRRRRATAKGPKRKENEGSEGTESNEGGAAPCPEPRRKHLGHVVGIRATRQEIIVADYGAEI